MSSILQTRLLAAVLLLFAFSAEAIGAAPQTEAGPFVASATQAGLMEIEAARLALEKSGNADVRGFATRMIAEHGKANEELKAIATRKGIPVPATLDAEHTKMLKPLRDASAKAFDKAYATRMVADHAAAVELFQANVVHPDSELAAFAGKTLPQLQEHKRLADNLRANLGK